MSSDTGLEPLRGSCSCGRNRYLIRIPEDVTDHARIYFDSSSDNRRHHGTPLTAWLRVPLDWFESHTRSYFPDETHSAIRRTFTPHHAPHTRRNFCGFCGTPLTYWTEAPRDEAEFMSVSIGSLYGRDQRLLEDLDLLPGSSEEEESEEESEVDEEVPTNRDPVPVSTTTAAAPSSSSVVVPTLASEPLRSYRSGMMSGIPWFEEMIEGSRLGRLMKARRGMGVSGDDSTKFAWEASEWHDDGTTGAIRQTQYSTFSSSSSGKRKRTSRGDAGVGNSRQKRRESP